MLTAALLLLAIPIDDVAFARGAEVWLANHDGSDSRCIAKNASYARPLVWSPDGKYLVHWSHEAGHWDLRRLQPESGESINLTADLGGGCRSASFSPDGRLIAFVHDGDPAGVYVMGPQGEDKRRVTGLGHRDFPPQWSQDGALLVVLDLAPSGSQMVMVSVADGSSAVVSQGRDAVWLRDREWLIVGESLKVVDARSLHEWKFNWAPESPTAFARSPHGRKLACANGNELLVYGLLPPGEPAVFPFEARVTAMSWSSDERRIAVSVAADSPEVGMVSLETGEKELIALGEWAAIRPARPNSSSGRLP